MLSRARKTLWLVSSDELVQRVLPARLELEGLKTRVLENLQELQDSWETDRTQCWALMIDMIPSGDIWSGLSQWFHSLEHDNRPMLTLISERQQLREHYVQLGTVDAVFERPLRIDRILQDLHALRERKRIPRARRYSRIPIKSTMEIKGYRFQNFKRFTVHNISPGGALIDTEGAQLAPGDSLLFTLHEGNRRHLALRGIGRVCWKSRDGFCGISFTTFFYNVGSEDVHRYIHERLISSRPRQGTSNTRFQRPRNFDPKNRG